MMDEVLGQSSEQSSPSASAPVEHTPAERTFRQSEVNELIGRVKKETEQKISQRYQDQGQYRQEERGYQAPISQGLSEDHYRKIASEEAQRLRDSWIADSQAKHEEELAKRTVNNFWEKVASGKEKYDDFDKVTGDIELSRFPNVVQLLADHMDNSGDVLYELGKNRLKLAQLEQLSHLSPRDAIVEARRLAESIKSNEDASRIKQPNAPLSQQRPSNVGTDAGGVLSMRDLKAKYRA